MLACAAGAAMLAASQFTDIFQLTPEGGEALAAIDANDQHGYANLILAAFALLMLVLGLAAGSARASESLSVAQVAFVAVAVCGIAGVLIFLIGDLPDVNKVGTLDDPRESFIDAKAEPQAGFWLELVGAAVLAICGAALATMRPGAPRLTELESDRSEEKAPERQPEPANTESG